MSGHLRVLPFIFLSCVLAACGSTAPQPTAAPTLVALTIEAPTAAPTATLSAPIEVTLGPVINVNNQFVINEVDSFVYRVAASRVEMVSLDGDILFIIGILPGTETDNSTELLSALQDSFGAFETAAAGSVLTADEEAAYQPFSSNKSGVNFEGAYALLPLGDGREFFALGVGRNNDVNAWLAGGEQAFRTVLGTVSLTVDPSLSLECAISPTAGYGLSPEQAVKVGGSILGEFNMNPTARVRAYFNTLRGPEGEMVGFERTGSVDTEDSILDAYRVETFTSEVTLYVDMYNYEPLFAPQGFMCAGDFPIAAP
ncbi:MAG: hypothetical protein KIS88_06955 [Anaerolineales bacterium]|nr:hypothetical protein [Anaerolineales bacterium]